MTSGRWFYLAPLAVVLFGAAAAGADLAPPWECPQHIGVGGVCENPEEHKIQDADSCYELDEYRRWVVSQAIDEGTRAELIAIIAKARELAEWCEQ